MSLGRPIPLAIVGADEVACNGATIYKANVEVT